MTAHDITTFASALRYLAQEESSKFRLDVTDIHEEPVLIYGLPALSAEVRYVDIGQDEIDEILRLLGLRVLLIMDFNRKLRARTYLLNWEPTGFDVQTGETEKFSASRAALIAAVRTWAEEKEKSK